MHISSYKNHSMKLCIKQIQISLNIYTQIHTYKGLEIKIQNINGIYLNGDLSSPLHLTLFSKIPILGMLIPL